MIQQKQQTGRGGVASSSAAQHVYHRRHHHHHGRLVSPVARRIMQQQHTKAAAAGNGPSTSYSDRDWDADHNLMQLLQQRRQAGEGHSNRAWSTAFFPQHTAPQPS
jgi:hypothetical protein